MKIIISTATLLFCIMANTAFGQGYVFRVLANKGTNQVKKAGSGETLLLKTGTTLVTGDELITASGAYIGLMHKSGKTIEVRNAGVNKISDLESKLATSSTTATTRYADFVVSKMNEGGDVNSGYQQNMKATGAVERAMGGALIVNLKNSSNVLNSEAIISWTDTQIENVTYVVSLENIFDVEIYSAETNKNKITINFDDENLTNERLVVFSVKVKGNDEMISTKCGITRMSPEDAAPITRDLMELKKELSEESSLNNLILASFYEENDLILDAATQYEKAISASPDVEDFQIMYEDFLIRKGLKKSNEKESDK